VGGGGDKRAWKEGMDVKAMETDRWTRTA